MAPFLTFRDYQVNAKALVQDIEDESIIEKKTSFPKSVKNFPLLRFGTVSSK